MKLSSGVDLIEIDRVRDALEKHGEKFLARIFTPAEQAQCAGRSESLAARFAAKEAAAKALGCGIGALRWVDVEILNDEKKAPRMFLHGEGERLAKELGLTTWSVSLSHTETHALALVVMAG